MGQPTIEEANSLRYIFMLKEHISLDMPLHLTVPIEVPGHGPTGVHVELSSVDTATWSVTDRLADLTEYLRTAEWLPSATRRRLKLGIRQARKVEGSGLGAATIVDVLVERSLHDQPRDTPAEAGTEWDDPSYPLVRAIRATNLLLRALRIAQSAQVPPIPSGPVQAPLLRFYTHVKVAELDGRVVPLVRKFRRGEFGIFDIEGSRPDPSTKVTVDPESGQQIAFALENLQMGFPVHLGKEKMVQAMRYLNKLGDTEAAVLSACTSVERTVDLMLMALLWEQRWEASNRDDAVVIDVTTSDIQIFAEGKALQRIKSELSPRLGGRPLLTTEGPLKHWFENGYRLRHRVVHGGYLPTQEEATSALEVSQAFITHLVDKLVDRNTKSPRTTFMMAGEEGMKKREKYSAKYRAIHSQIATQEGSWRHSLTQFHDTLAAALQSRSG